VRGTGERVFVDTGAWIALAARADAYHARASAAWNDIVARRIGVVTSVPVMIETFTFLDRNANRDVAIRWRDQLTSLPRIVIAECSLADLTKSWRWLELPGLVRLSVVDATSFVLMHRLKLKRAFAYDQHFAQAGFAIVG
jgi:uncharacterized protein